MLYQIANGGRFLSRGQGRHPTRRIDSDELIYVLKGELSMFEDDRSFRVTAGEWLILRRGRKHGGLAIYPRNLLFSGCIFWHLTTGSKRSPSRAGQKIRMRWQLMPRIF